MRESQLFSDYNIEEVMEQTKNKQNIEEEVYICQKYQMFCTHSTIHNMIYKNLLFEKFMCNNEYLS